VNTQEFSTWNQVVTTQASSISGSGTKWLNSKPLYVAG